MLYAIVVGGIAGWLASTIMKGKGMGIIMNVILGVLGAFVGAYILPILGLSIKGWMSGIVSPTVGAIVVLFVAKILAK